MPQRNQRGFGNDAYARGGRPPRRSARQPDPQRAGPDDEVQRWLKGQGLPVNADIHRTRRAHLELGRRPIVPAREAPSITRELQRASFSTSAAVSTRTETTPGRPNRCARGYPRRATAPSDTGCWTQAAAGGRRFLAGRQRVAQVERRSRRPQQVRQHGGHRLHLGVPVVRRLTIFAYTPIDALLTKTRPLTARSTTVSTPSWYGQRARDVVAVETQIQREMVAVPAGTTMRGMPCLLATDATSAWEPSPPAIPSTSAPRATASSASWRRSSLWAQHDGPDVALPAQVDQPEAFGLPATGPEVHQQHRMTRTWRTLSARPCAG